MKVGTMELMGRLWGWKSTQISGTLHWKQKNKKRGYGLHRKCEDKKKKAEFRTCKSKKAEMETAPKNMRAGGKNKEEGGLNGDF